MMTDPTAASVTTGRRKPAGGPGKDERGGQISILVLLLAVGLIVAIGLAVDGNQKVTAAQQAENAAAAAARTGSEAAATNQLAGDDDGAGPVAARAARSYLAQAGVPGSVQIADGQVVVETTVRAPTKLLTIIGINTVTGHGHATSALKAAA